MMNKSEALIKYAIYAYYHVFDDDFVCNKNFDKKLKKIAEQTNYDDFIKDCEKYYG